MKNKFAGILIIIFALIMGYITYSFDMTFNEMAKSSCMDITQGLSCPLQHSVEFQINISLSLIVLMIITGVYLIFFSREEKIVTRIKKVQEQVSARAPTKENYRGILSELDKDEKTILERIIESNGSLLQSDLIKKTNFSKVRITRALDKLEGRGLIERKRRGMTNVVILKS